MKKKRLMKAPSVQDWRRLLAQPLPGRMHAAVKAKAGEDPLAFIILSTIAYRMIDTPHRWKIFIRYAPGFGPAFTQKVLAATHDASGDPPVRWFNYATRVVFQAIYRCDVTAPPDCLLSRERVRERWRAIGAGPRWQRPLTLSTVLRAHFDSKDDPSALKRLTGVFCVGCKVRGCRHHLDPSFRSVLPPPPVVPERFAPHESGTYKRTDPHTPVHLPVVPAAQPLVRFRIA